MNLGAICNEGVLHISQSSSHILDTRWVGWGVLSFCRDAVGVFYSPSRQGFLLFSSKYEVCWKSIETEAVFTKTEMNNEWNVDFLQNTSCFKKYRDWSCIYQDRNEQWMKRWFSLKYELCLKSIETGAVFSKIEINNEWNVDFLQNTSCLDKVLRWSCIFQDRNEQWMKRWFFSKYEQCWKSIQVEAVFSMTA